MESTSNPDHGRQSRGLSRFWPVHATSAPEQRQSDDASSEGGSSSTDAEVSADGPAEGGSSVSGSSVGPSLPGGPFSPADAGPVAGSGPTGEQPQVDAVRHAARAGDTHIVALGSRRLPEIVNGRPPGQGGFPSPETEREARAAEPGPRHGGPPIPTALPLPPGRSPLGATDVDAVGGSPFRPNSAPFGTGSPFAPAAPFGRRGARPVPGDGGPRDPRGGSPAPRHDGTGRRRDAGAEPDRVGDDRQRRDAQRSRAASGWASLPTSGIPTLSGRATVDEAATGTPVAGSRAETSRSSTEDVAGSPSSGGTAGDSSDGGSRTLDGNAGSAGRRRDDEPRVAAPRRSTTLDDAEELRPRAGRRAAPETADEVDGRSDRHPGSADAAPPEASNPNSGPAGEDGATADQEDGTPKSGSREDKAEARTSRDGNAEDAVPDKAGRDGTADDAARDDASRDGAAKDAAADDASRNGTADAAVSRDGADVAGDGVDATPHPGAGRNAAARADAEPDDTAAADPGPEDTTASPVSADAGTEATSDAPMRPGDVEETLIAFWDDKVIERFRSEWHEVKADFVDDPVAALTRAHDLITEAVDDLSEALLAERDQLDPLRTTSTPDTESMRMAMRGYREFLDRILAL